MASQWWSYQETVPEDTSSKDQQEELFVFGYACKIFRDDVKAQYVEDGKHLIPWMGDDRLMIDRYDGRGHLFDLSTYDADNLTSEQKAIPEDERPLEALCEEERYLELHVDLAEQAVYEEEEWKRYYESLSEGYKAVGFSYDYPYGMDAGGAQGFTGGDAEEVEEEEPFVPAKELQIPPGLALPVSEKENAIIEKTAKLIAEHGPQMEIMIKAKQKNNPQFEFLHFEDRLSPYYKHVVKMIKSGKYKPKAEAERQESHEEESDHHYLHPSLVSNRASPTLEPFKPVPAPKVNVHETHYGQLIRHIAKTNKQAAEKVGSRHRHARIEEKAQLNPPPLPPYMSQPAYGPSHPGVPPPPGLEPVTLPSNQPPPPGTDELMLPDRDSPDLEDSSSRDSPQPSQIVPPPPDIQPIIDRMAMYVAKNGEEFEMVVKSKNDPRFEFLQPWHMHFAYYDFKKQIKLKEMEKEKKKREKEKLLEAAESTPKGVSFSIKPKPKEQEAVPLEKKRPVFDYESSDDENDGESDGREKVSKSDASGTSTPDPDTLPQRSEPREERPEKTEVPVEVMERKQAEEKLKDRLAAAARDKLAQASKEKQIKAERKRKAAMFINMLKTGNQIPVVQVTEDLSSHDAQDSGSSHGVTTPPISTPMSSGTTTPIPHAASSGWLDEEFSAAKLREEEVIKKQKSRSRSDKNRRSRSPSYSKSHKTKSRSRSPVRRRRSPTPPSAYSIVRRSLSRSPVRRLPPPRISPVRRRERSPSPRIRQISKARSPQKSRSPILSKPSTSSRKRSRSRSVGKPSTSTSSSTSRSSNRKDKTESSRSTSKKSKKHKKSRSRSRSPSRKKTKTSSKSSKSSSRDKKHSRKTEIKVKQEVCDNKVESTEVNTEVEEVEREVEVQDEEESNEASLADGADEAPEDEADPTDEDEDLDPESSPEYIVKDSLSAEDTVDQQSQDMPSNNGTSLLENEDDEKSNESVNSSGSKPELANSTTNKPVSNYMLSRVRAMLKASRQAILKEEGSYLDDP